MNIIPIICLVLTLFAPVVYGAEKPLKISSQTISPSEVKRSKNEILIEFAADNYATLISIENAPETNNFNIKIERPLLREFPSEKDKLFHNETNLNKSVMDKMAKDFTSRFPCFVIKSEGFLPGEEVSLIVECEGFKSEPLKFYPHPLDLKSNIDDARITVRLAGMISTTSTYSFSFNNFPPNEKIKYSSECWGEKLSKFFEIKNKSAFILTCGVVGYKGGLNTVKFFRNNGEVLEVIIPWGTDLVDHLYGETRAIQTQSRMEKQKK